jgi:hypothetical protein
MGASQPLSIVPATQVPLSDLVAFVVAQASRLDASWLPPPLGNLSALAPHVTTRSHVPWYCSDNSNGSGGSILRISSHI